MAAGLVAGFWSDDGDAVRDRLVERAVFEADAGCDAAELDLIESRADSSANSVGGEASAPSSFASANWVDCIAAASAASIAVSCSTVISRR